MPQEFRNQQKSKHKIFSQEHKFYFQTQIWSISGPNGNLKIESIHKFSTKVVEKLDEHLITRLSFV